MEWSLTEGGMGKVYQKLEANLGSMGAVKPKGTHSKTPVGGPKIQCSVNEARFVAVGQETKWARKEEDMRMV
jgi:hypothetical protein